MNIAIRTDASIQKAIQKTIREQTLDLLSADAELTRDDLAAAIGVSPNTVKQHLANLQQGGLLTREGGREQGRWKVMSK